MAAIWAKKWPEFYQLGPDVGHVHGEGHEKAVNVWKDDLSQ